MSDFVEHKHLRYRFHEYRETRDANSSEEVSRIYCCPCCDYPMLGEPGGYEICLLCDWEDDGYDGFGPNACSLEDARNNFRRYLTSYSADHKCAPDAKTGEAHFIHEYKLRPKVLAAKRQYMRNLDAFMAEVDLAERGRILARADEAYMGEESPAFYRVAVMHDGRISLNETPMTLEELDVWFDCLGECIENVWYYREPADGEPHPNTMKVNEMIEKYGLPVSYSTKADYSDVIKRNFMHAVAIQIVRFTDAHFPGWVECILSDAFGREWVFMEKVPMFTTAGLDERSSYPQPGEIACEIVREWVGEDGRRRCVIDTERPCGIAAKDGETEFEVFFEQVAAHET